MIATVIALILVVCLPFAGLVSLHAWRRAHQRFDFAATVTREIDTTLAVVSTNRDSVVRGQHGPRSAGLVIECVALRRSPWP